MENQQPARQPTASQEKPFWKKLLDPSNILVFLLAAYIVVDLGMRMFGGG